MLDMLLYVGVAVGVFALAVWAIVTHWHFDAAQLHADEKALMEALFERFDVPAGVLKVVKSAYPYTERLTQDNWSGDRSTYLIDWGRLQPNPFVATWGSLPQIDLMARSLQSPVRIVVTPQVNVQTLEEELRRGLQLRQPRD